MLLAYIISIVSKRKTKEDYHDLAKSHGFKWLGSILPKNATIKTWWECKKKHRWKARYSTIQSGNGCKKCAIEASRKTKKDYNILVKTHNLKWVGKKLPKRIMDKTWWEYENGYLWKTTFNNIQRGRNCLKYSGKLPKTMENYHELAKNCGLKWVDNNLPKNIETGTQWECKKCKHIWKTTYNNIQQGSRCPRCYFESIQDENNSNWNPKLTNKDRINRRLLSENGEWAYKVKERDDFTCQICRDNKGGNLVSHHLYSYMSWSKLRLILKNGICRCKKCHREFHRIYGYGNNTEKQFKEFRLTYQQ